MGRLNVPLVMVMALLKGIIHKRTVPVAMDLVVSNAATAVGGELSIKYISNLNGDLNFLYIRMIGINII